MTDELTAEETIDLDAVVAELHKQGHDSAYVEQTGGGCATVYVGPTCVDKEGDTRWVVALAGPGWFDGPNWTRGRGQVGDFYVGPDDDGESDFWSHPATVTHNDPVMIAQAIAAQVRATIASR